MLVVGPRVAIKFPVSQWTPVWDKKSIFAAQKLLIQAKTISLGFFLLKKSLLPVHRKEAPLRAVRAFLVKPASLLQKVLVILNRNPDH